MLDAVAVGVTGEERAARGAEEPSTAGMRRNPVLSTVLPVVVWMVRAAMLDDLRRLVSP